jgi:hypothetical protein
VGQLLDIHNWLLNLLDFGCFSERRAGWSVQPRSVPKLAKMETLPLKRRQGSEGGNGKEKRMNNTRSTKWLTRQKDGIPVICRHFVKGPQAAVPGQTRAF